jgi:glycosyltransferase involved in cell wall biosynthesis
MKFSLVMATLGRDKEPALFLESLKNQTYNNYELIIVDQNEDDRIDKIVSAYNMDITVIKSNIKGLSYNRNIGIRYVTGDIISFPDDDCEYEPDTLMKVTEFFNTNSNYSFYTCNTKDKYKSGSVFRGLKKDCNVNLFNFLNTGISFAMFFRKGALACFTLDEKLGIGTYFGSGEDSDLLLYLLKNKLKGKYFANNFIFHPAKIELLPQRVVTYSRGHGAMFRKGISVYKFYILFFIYIFRLIPYLLKSVFMPGNKVAQAVAKGRIKGFLEYNLIIR